MWFQGDCQLVGDSKTVLQGIISSPIRHLYKLFGSYNLLVISKFNLLFPWLIAEVRIYLKSYEASLYTISERHVH